MRWKAYLKAGSREDASEIRDYPVRVSDIDIFDHMNNSVYWSVIEDYLYSQPELVQAPLRVTIEHDAAVALGDKLEIVKHVHPAGSTDTVRRRADRSHCYNAHIRGRRRDEGHRSHLRALTRPV